MNLFKSLFVLAQTVFDAWRGAFLEQTKGLGKDMIAIAQGKTKKEMEMEKEVKNQKRILKAQQIAKEQLELED